MARVLRPIVVNGTLYNVLRLDGGSSNVRYILRNGRGELFGVYGRNAQAALSAAPLTLKLAVDNPLRGVDLFEDEDGSLVVGLS